MDECSEPKVKSLAKSLKILSCFTIQEPVMGVTELAELIGVTKSNIHNILSTFTSMGYLDPVSYTHLFPLISTRVSPAWTPALAAGLRGSTRRIMVLLTALRCV